MMNITILTLELKNKTNHWEVHIPKSWINPILNNIDISVKVSIIAI